MNQTESLLLVTAATLALMLKENPYHRHAETIRTLIGMAQDHLDTIERTTGQ